MARRGDRRPRAARTGPGGSAPAKQLLAFTREGDVFTIDSDDYSLDGKRVVFTSNPDRQVERGTVLVVGVDSKGLHRLTAGADPDWKP